MMVCAVQLRDGIPKGEEAVRAKTNGDQRFASSFIFAESEDGDGEKLVLRGGWKGRQESYHGT